MGDYGYARMDRKATFQMKTSDAYLAVQRALHDSIPETAKTAELPIIDPLGIYGDTSDPYRINALAVSGMLSLFSLATSMETHRPLLDMIMVPLFVFAFAYVTFIMFHDFFNKFEYDETVEVSDTDIHQTAKAYENVRLTHEMWKSSTRDPLLRAIRELNEADGDIRFELSPTGTIMAAVWGDSLKRLISRELDALAGDEE